MPSGDGRVVADRYRLTALLGRGGTAEVWRAEDEALGRSVALKLVTVQTDESAARAGEEARLLARLSHPALVPVYDAGTDEHGPPVGRHGAGHRRDAVGHHRPRPDPARPHRRHRLLHRRGARLRARRRAWCTAT